MDRGASPPRRRGPQEGTPREHVDSCRHGLGSYVSSNNALPHRLRHAFQLSLANHICKSTGNIYPHILTCLLKARACMHAHTHTHTHVGTWASVLCSSNGPRMSPLCKAPFKAVYYLLLQKRPTRRSCQMRARTRSSITSQGAHPPHRPLRLETCASLFLSLHDV